MRKKVLIIRFSSLGDLAISVPLVKAVCEKYPEYYFFMLSRPYAADLMQINNSNFNFIGADVNHKYHGFFGLLRLFIRKKLYKMDIICDFHGNIRSYILAFFSFLCFKRIYFIKKGRRDRKELVRRKDKVFSQKRTSFQRYADVLAKAGFNVPGPVFFTDADKSGYMESVSGVFGEKRGKWIGIAPFAKHKGKIYPVEKTEEVVSFFAGKSGYKIFLFGGGDDEFKILNAWKNKYDNVIIASGKGILFDIKIISCLDVMLSMDSANLHLSSLVGTPVVSVWGATHRYAGFYGLGQDLQNIVEVPLSCRPCSVYGNVPCYRNDYACLNEISSGQIIDKMLSVLKNEKDSSYKSGV